jgi:SAM-dependent methyltransferase
VPNTRFQHVSGRWADGLGQVRDAVRQEIVRRQLSELTSAGSLRVIDVGCGQGTQLLHLARAGHQVTGLDISPDLLARCRADLIAESDEVRERVTLREGPLEEAIALAGTDFDLVVCHGVLMYFDQIGVVLRVLDGLAGAGARLALLVRNGLALAMRDGLRGDGAGALASFDSLEYVNRLGIAARAHTPGCSTRNSRHSGGIVFAGMAYVSSPIIWATLRRQRTDSRKCWTPKSRRPVATPTGKWRPCCT